MIFEHFKIALVLPGQFRNFQKCTLAIYPITQQYCHYSENVVKIENTIGKLFNKITGSEKGKHQCYPGGTAPMISFGNCVEEFRDISRKTSVIKFCFSKVVRFRATAWQKRNSVAGSFEELLRFVVSYFPEKLLVLFIYFNFDPTQYPLKQSSGCPLQKSCSEKIR